MKRTHIALVALAATFALGSGDAWAQRSAGSAPVTGSAVPRGSDGGGGAAPASSGGSTSSNTSSGSTSPGTAGASTAPGGGNLFVRSPSRSETLAYAPQRRGGGGSGQSTGSRAVPRGSSGGGSTSSTAPSGTRSGSSTAPSGSRSGSSTAGTRSSGGDRRAVPTYSRPRDDRPVRGYATERGSVPPPPGGGGIIVYPPYYPWYGYPYYGYGGWGLGFGYGFYDPFWSPYGYGYGGGTYYGGGSSYDSDMVGTGALRLKVSPRGAKVYVDGYFVGEVDEFDGMFQKLSLDAGGHTIEIKAEGFETAQLDVMITPGETVTYKGELVSIGK